MTAQRAMGENGEAAMTTAHRTIEPPFTDVPGALAEIRVGRMVVVVDDEDRENEGDLTLAAEPVTFNQVGGQVDTSIDDPSAQVEEIRPLG